MMRIFITLTGMLLLCLSCYGQKQDNVWCLGKGGGVDFNTTPPTKFTSSTSAIETTATVSDRNTGDLLFYSNGSKIWDASHNVMQNGADIGLNEKTQTSAQGCVVIPFIDDENKYYVFTRPSIGAFRGQLYYSVVDMTLNNRLGGVMPGMKKILLGEGYTEAMIAMSGCRVIWLVTQNAEDGSFYSYRISAEGISATPVISTLNYSKRPDYETAIKASPDYKKIAVTGRIFEQKRGDAYLAIHDFNAETGKVNGGMLADTTANIAYYGMEFSPNGKLLYASSSRNVYQYNISLPTTSAITASKTIISKSTSYFLNGMQLRDDGNIYIIRYESEYMDMISNCNALAPACVYTDKALEIGGVGTYGIPARVALPKNGNLMGSNSVDTSICNGKAIMLSVTGEKVTWHNGSHKRSFNAIQPGVYWVRSYNSSCEMFTDTFNVQELRIEVTINKDTILCTGDSMSLYSNTQPDGVGYLWSTGSTGDRITVSEGGVYSLTVTRDGCTATDEAVVTYHPATSIELGNDTQVCNDVIIPLPQTATSAETDKYLWQDGSTARTFEAKKAGKYWVRVTNQCQSIIDSIVISGKNCRLFFPSAFSPNGDGLNDIARMVGDVAALTDFRMSIYNRWGETVFTTYNPLKGWNGMQGPSLADVGAYYYQIQYTYKGERGQMKGDLTLLR